MRLLCTFAIACCIGRVTWAQYDQQRCVTASGGAGTCVTEDWCDPITNTVYDDGSSIISARLGTDIVKCPAPLKCCSSPQSTASPIDPQNAARTNDPQNAGLPVSPQDTAYPNDPLDAHPIEMRAATSSPDTNQGCGVQKRQTVRGFVKTLDNEADPGEFPWAVTIMLMDGMDEQNRIKVIYAGTGSLIHDRVVLTSAHKLLNKDTNNMRAGFGDHDILQRVIPKKMLEIREVAFHKDFNVRNGDYNFALAFIRGSALKDLPNVGTVCLPPANYVPPVGSSCVFSGWGFDALKKHQNQLTKTEVPTVSRSECERKLRQNPLLGPGFFLLPTFTCAGGEVNKNLCGGAGGSPLVCPIEGQPNRYVQTGIVSWVTAGCGVTGEPAVFSDVAMARPWIDQQMAEHQYSTTSYTY